MGLFVRGHTQSVFKRKLNIAQLKFIKSLSQAIIKCGPFVFQDTNCQKFSDFANSIMFFSAASFDQNFPFGDTFGYVRLSVQCT